MNIEYINTFHEYLDHHYGLQIDLDYEEGKMIAKNQVVFSLADRIQKLKVSEAYDFALNIFNNFYELHPQQSYLNYSNYRDQTPEQ